LLLINGEGGTYEVGANGNENVVTLVKASSGLISASYEYDGFGNTLKSTGEYAAENPFKFSTKYADHESGLIYYGFRYYGPSTGRWLGRDPIEESGVCENTGSNCARSGIGLVTQNADRDSEREASV
jgi:RHS repeat-associated protein